MKTIFLAFCLLVVSICAMAQFPAYVHNAYDTNDTATVDAHVVALIGNVGVPPGLVTNGSPVAITAYTIDSVSQLVFGGTNFVLGIPDRWINASPSGYSGGSSNNSLAFKLGTDRSGDTNDAGFLHLVGETGETIHASTHAGGGLTLSSGLDYNGLGDGLTGIPLQNQNATGVPGGTAVKFLGTNSLGQLVMDSPGGSSYSFVNDGSYAGLVTVAGSTVTVGTNEPPLTFTGDVTGTGSNSIALTIGANKVTTTTINALAVTTAKIATSAVGNSQLAAMGNLTFKGNNSGSTGSPQDVTIAALKLLILLGGWPSTNISFTTSTNFVGPTNPFVLNNSYQVWNTSTNVTLTNIVSYGDCSWGVLTISNTGGSPINYFGTNIGNAIGSVSTNAYAIPSHKVFVVSVSQGNFCNAPSQ